VQPTQAPASVWSGQRTLLVIVYAYYFEHQLGCVVHIFIHKAEYGVVSIHTAWPNAWNSSKQISWMWNPKVILNSSSLINECILPENSQYVIFITEPDDYYALTNLNTNKATLLLHVFLKHCSSALVATMFYLFTTSLNTSIIPTE